MTESNKNKLNSILYKAIFQNFLVEATKYTDYLIRTKQHKALKRFKKVLNVIGNKKYEPNK